MEFEPGCYYVAIWFAALRIKRGNISGVLWRKDSEPTTWHVDFRFRYYRDDAAWNSADSKSGYRGLFSGSEEDAIRAVDKMFRAVGRDAETYWIRGDVDRALELVTENPAPWMHGQWVIQE